MSGEKKETLEHLVEYLQDKIDTGYHKIFYNDDMYDEKTIDCINAINDTLEENNRLNNIIDKAIEYHNNCIENLDLDKIDDNEKLAYKVAYGIHNNYLKILKGE